ncbi:MAG: phenylalanine--tRNA ligase subunit beta [Candidatus Nanohaloarchaeota archaeon QJJ-5]|nr:phenylalanine--tRNA ligase subunit beta [Candidatus Nanohaloarchaeota archaeon QJJ-5]
MPTIEFNKDDLLDLIGEDLSDTELEDQLTRAKVEVEEIIDDRVEVEITSDRIDLLSVEGIARSLRASLGKDTGLTQYETHASEHTMFVKDVPARPDVVAAVVKDVELNTPAMKSLIQLQEKLHGTFGRHRERVSIGIHDISDIRFPLTYKDATPDEYRFIPLEHEDPMDLATILDEHEKGKTYRDIIDQYDRYPIIVDDDDNVLSFPPIINSTRTEVTTASTDLFIDVTGTDRESLEYALNVICTALAERGGDIYEVELRESGKTERTPDFSTRERSVDLEYISTVIGIDLDHDEAKEYLEKVGYGVIEIGDTFDVVIPPYRADILHDIDIAEDVAIGYGYNELEPTLPDISTIGDEDPLEKFMHSVRDLMTGYGYQEIMNPTVTDTTTLVHDANREEADVIEIANPVSDNYTVARDTLLPQLLDTLAENTHNSYPQQIFEAADVLVPDEDRNVKVRTDKHLAGIEADRDTGYTDMRSTIQGLLASLDVEPRFEKTYHSSFIEGRCAAIMLGEDRIGTIGEVHPGVLNNHAIEMPVTAFELNLDTIREHRQ